MKLVKRLSYVLIANTLIFYAPAFANEYQHIIHPGSSKVMTLDELEKLYPNATIKKVSTKDYAFYKELYANKSEEIPVAKKTKRRFNPCLAPKRPPGSKPQQIYPSTQYPRSGTDYNVNPKRIPKPKGSGWFGSGKADKDFLVIVAVIGVLVVAALLVYSVGYLIEMAKAGFSCKAWNEFGFQTSTVSDHTESQLRSGDLTGIFFSIGYKIPVGVLGLSFELGHHNIDLEVIETSEISQFDGGYLLVGPKFTFPFGYYYDSHSFQIELLAGTSTSDSIRLMSTLRFGVNLALTEHFSLGINLGAALIDIEGFDNYLSDQDHLNYLSGLGATMRF